jgi:GNAT superfamily N-acetyltransferase
MRIALLDPADTRVAEEIQSLLKVSYHDDAHHLGVASLLPMHRTVEEVRTAGTTFFGGLRDDGLIAVAEVVDEGDGTSPHIASFAVRPDVRRQGIGSGLLRQLLLWFARRAVTISTVARNRPALRLCTRLGFRVWTRWRTPDGVDMITLATPDETRAAVD